MFSRHEADVKKGGQGPQTFGGHTGNIVSPSGRLTQGEKGDPEYSRENGVKQPVQPHSQLQGETLCKGPYPTTNNGGAVTQAEQYVRQLEGIYNAVSRTGKYNYKGARIRVPSGLCIEAWESYLSDYTDQNLVSFLAYGWPVNHDRTTPLQSTFVEHPSAAQHARHVDFYLKTELSFQALAGPFQGPPVPNFHASPLMTRPKKDSDNRRVIVDLSWPDGAAVNDGIPTDWYLDGPANIRLPTVEYMEQRILSLGPGAFLYKTDLARGYRQLRVDPTDWPLLGFTHNGVFYMDVCPPFGLRSSALFMQRTSEAISYVHRKAGYISRPYLDDFGGAEATRAEAHRALTSLQAILNDLGVREAVHKVCGPAQRMIWLGLLYDTLEMTISIPPEKMEEIMCLIEQWSGKKRATLKEIQSLLGTLQFVAGVSPPTRVFTNRILHDLREAPKRGTETLSWGFKRDIQFFAALLPHFNGVKILNKQALTYQNELELDACLTGCGACTGTQHYAERFPQWIIKEAHPIAHLELLNVVVAVKVWRQQWAGHRVQVFCDNTNACVAATTGRSRDPFIQECVRELFLFKAAHDIELTVTHRPGVQMERADALSRAHTDKRYSEWIDNDAVLAASQRIAVPEHFFAFENKL